MVQKIFHLTGIFSTIFLKFCRKFPKILDQKVSENGTENRILSSVMVWLHWQKFCHSVQFFRHFSVTLWSGILPPRIPRPEIVKEIIRKLLEILSWNPVGWKILVFENSRNCTEFAQNSRICAELQNLHRIPEFVQNLRRISTELTRHFWDFLDCFGEILSHRKILCQNSGPKSNRNVTEKDAEWKNFC